ncbi:hypothetical protein QSE00_06635 [Arenibacter sp. M-2]|uniref:hypothetical protein n=1 Tax=unclassified Arenibacter TaxID=2615047 RepID=UPI000D771A07|nr:MULTISPECIES: hypothetical protein [unclassified Arenibacter]MDL5511481.1 hypothetical protein [Arenibacter sp. M-2]PXX24209.1 hypothetical protein C7972_11611 [Arenibacter sp. ARW7G5Y1]
MKKSKKSKGKPLYSTIDLSKNEIVVFNIEEIKSMREEINWRVKAAYNSSIAFISVITFIIGQLLNRENGVIESIQEDPNLFMMTSIAMLIVISAWVGVQNANHLIEKRIELYSLDLMKTIHSASEHIFFSWLGYLYGHVYFRKKVKNMLAKLLNASIGFFIYFLPNLIAFGLWVFLLGIDGIRNHIPLFILATFFIFIAILTSFLLFFYVIKVNKRYTDFHDNYMKPYFEAKKGIITSH